MPPKVAPSPESEDPAAEKMKPNIALEFLNKIDPVEVLARDIVAAAHVKPMPNACDAEAVNNAPTEEKIPVAKITDVLPKHNIGCQTQEVYHVTRKIRNAERNEPRSDKPV